MSLPGSAESRFVGVIATVHGVVHTVELTYAALLTRIALEFDSDKLALGSVATAAAFTLGLGALPAGVLVDRLGPRRTLDVTFGSAAVAAILVALSPSLGMLAGTLALLGLCAGLYHPAGISAIAVASRHASSALGWHGVGGNSGAALAPALAGLVAAAAGWRWAYVLVAALCVLSIALLHLFLPGQRALDEERPPAPPAASAPRRRGRWGLLVLVYAASVTGGFVYRGSVTFLPAHIEENVAGGTAIAGALTTIVLFAGAAGQVLGGHLGRYFQLERLAIPLVALGAPALVLTGVSSGAVLVLFAAAFVFVNFSAQPVFTALVAQYSPTGGLGRSYGVLFFASFGVGSAAGAFAGYFADRWGTGAVFEALAVLAAGTLAFTILLALRAARRTAEPVLEAV